MYKENFEFFPSTRYMGSKNKIIHSIWDILKDYEFNSFYDAFAGSNVVSFFMKCMGKQVITNDFMMKSFVESKAMIENSNVQLNDEDVDFLLSNENDSCFISKKFKNLYFSDKENQFLDKVRGNISSLKDEYKRAIALSSLSRACIKKRPRGIFTYVGHRYDDGRKDIKKTLKQHFVSNVSIINNAIFDNKKENFSNNLQTENLNIKADLVYLDPPYYSQKSDNDYVRRYHFVEGLVKNWKGLEIQEHTKTKKFKSYKSPFSKKETTYTEFDTLFQRFSDSIIVISYSSNSLPTKDEMVTILKKYKSNVVVHEIDHLYSFGNQNHKIGNNSNRVKEYLFIGV